MTEEIIIDKGLLKAIGADARISILKSLGKHQKTQSDLAKELKLSAPTILEHLNQLEEAGLVERKEEGRKWKYYTLTRKGEKIVSSSNKKIGLNVFIALGVILIFAAVIIFNTPHVQTGSSEYGADGEKGDTDEKMIVTSAYEDLETGSIPKNHTNLTGSTE